jgi:hypothetical protein
MPRPRHVFTVSDRTLLREALNARLGFPLDGKSACLRASDALRALGGYAPSGTTLYHLLIAPLDGRRPYPDTLHALARLLGAADWHALRRLRTSEADRIAIDQHAVLEHPSLLAVCIRGGHYAAVDDFLEQWADRIDHVALYDLGLALYSVLHADPTATVPFYQRYAIHPVVRKAFFEQMADPDFRLANADQGLQHYLAATGTGDDGKGLGDRLFARSMLFRHHFLCGDPRAVEAGRSLYANMPAQDLLTAIHLYPATRYLTYALWYDVMQRRTDRRLRRESLVMEWIAERLREERTSLERDILFHTLVEGAHRAGLLNRLVPDILRLFPDIDPDGFTDASSVKRLIAAKDTNAVSRLFTCQPHSA